MKRLFYSAGIVLMVSILGSCAQHDTKSPDTSGSLPTTQPGVGVDTTNVGNTTGNGGANMNNDGTNNNQQTNTGDTTQQR